MDSLFNNAEDFSELHIFQDKSIPFFAVICMHNNDKGPAIGGCRFVSYSSTTDAIQDAIRLSRAMRLKSSVSQLPHDGGKAVIMLPKVAHDRNAILKKFAECVESLGGKYITTIDSGTTPDDMAVIHQHTSYVTGYEVKDNDHHPSTSTALGVYEGIKASIKAKKGKNTLEGISVAVQGLGSVGYRLVNLLKADGAILTVTDANIDLAQRISRELNATFVMPDDIYHVACDVFSPCALGKVLNEETLPRLKAEIIAGAANDQLIHDGIAKRLHDKKILYIPDFLINAGGLIHLALEKQGKDTANIKIEVKRIADRIQAFMDESVTKNISLLETIHQALT